MPAPSCASWPGQIAQVYVPQGGKLRTACRLLMPSLFFFLHGPGVDPVILRASKLKGTNEDMKVEKLDLHLLDNSKVRAEPCPSPQQCCPHLL